MQLRIVLLVVLALVASGCAGSEVSDGIGVSGGSEQMASDEAPQETSSSPVPDEPIPTEDTSVNPNESDSNQEREPEQENTDGTTLALVTSTSFPKSTPVPSTAPTPEEPVPQAVAESGFVGIAKEDLANRLGIGVGSIEVVSVQEVDWPDAGIGCPQPGMVYAQKITNGSRIILSYGGVDYSYHSAGAGDPFYCENPSDPVPASGS